MDITELLEIHYEVVEFIVNNEDHPNISIIRENSGLGVIMKLLGN